MLFAVAIVIVAVVCCLLLTRECCSCTLSTIGIVVSALLFCFGCFFVADWIVDDIQSPAIRILLYRLLSLSLSLSSSSNESQMKNIAFLCFMILLYSIIPSFTFNVLVSVQWCYFPGYVFESDDW